MIDGVAIDASSTEQRASLRREPRRARRVRMTGAERREQLLDIGRTLFAEQGFEGTSVEEIAAKAGVSKPVVYEHFGGKEGLYAVVVDREMRQLLDMVTGALTAGHPRELLRAGGVRAARLHRGVHGRLPHPGPRLPRRPVDGHLRLADQRHRHPGRGHPGPGVQGPRLRPEAGPAVRAGPGRHGRADRPVVAGRPQAEEGRGGGASGEPGLARPGRSGAEAAADRAPEELSDRAGARP